METKYFKIYEDNIWKYVRVFLADSTVELAYFKPVTYNTLEDTNGVLEAKPVTEVKGYLQTIEYSTDDSAIEDYEFTGDPITYDEFMAVYDEVVKDNPIII